MSTKTPISTETRFASEPRSASEPPSPTETHIPMESPLSASEPIDTAETLLIKKASIIFGVCIEEIQYVLENGIRMETQYGICGEEITTLSELQLIALQFVIKHYGDKDLFILMPKRYGMHRNIDADELVSALDWISQFEQFKHICDSNQLGSEILFIVWSAPVVVSAAPLFIPTEGTLENMIDKCRKIIIGKEYSWKKQLNAQVTTMKEVCPDMYYKDMYAEIVAALKASNDRHCFALLKKRFLEAVRSYLSGCISNVKEGIAHEYSADEQLVCSVELNSFRVKSLISAIYKLVSFVRAMSRIFAKSPAVLKDFYWERIVTSATGISGDLSYLRESVGVDLVFDFDETPKRYLEPENYSVRRTLGNPMGGSPMRSRTDSNEDLNIISAPESVASVVNSQEEYKTYRSKDQLKSDISYTTHFPPDVSIFGEHTVPSGLFDAPKKTEDDDEIDFDSENPPKCIPSFNSFGKLLMLILIKASEMQSLVDNADSVLTPDDAATHESANKDFTEHFEPIIEETVSKLTEVMRVFNDFIAQCDEALKVPAITDEQFREVNTVLSKNKAPAKKADATDI